MTCLGLVLARKGLTTQGCDGAADDPGWRRAWRCDANPNERELHSVFTPKEQAQGKLGLRKGSFNRREEEAQSIWDRSDTLFIYNFMKRDDNSLLRELDLAPIHTVPSLRYIK
jgi:hypothetical protein